MNTLSVRRAKGILLVHFSLVAYLVSVPVVAYTPVGADASQALGVATAAVFGLDVLVRRQRVRLPLELLLFGAFIAYTFIGGFLAHDASGFLSRQFTLIQVWVLAFVMFNVLTDHSSGDLVGLRAIQFGVLGAAVLAVTGTGAATGRLAGTMANPNTYGLASLLGIAATLLIPVRGRLGRVFQPGLILFFAWQAALSGSRKAILGVLGLGTLIGVVSLLRSAKRPGRAVAVALLVGVALTAGLAWAQNTPFWYRVENIALFASGEDVNEGSLSARTDLARTAVEVWRLHPVLGVGTDQFRYYAGDYGLPQTYAHSNPLEVLANLGVIGAILYYAIYATLTVRIVSGWARERSAPRKTRLGLIGCIWLTWVTLEVAWVSYYSKLHWIAVVLLLVATYNTRSSNSASARIG